MHIFSMPDNSGSSLYASKSSIGIFGRAARVGWALGLAVRNVTDNKWPTTAPDHRATRECASCGLNRMPLGAVVRPAFIWGYVRHLFASRLCPLALRARLPARRAYRYGDQDVQQCAPDGEMGWGGMQGAKATRYNYNPRDRGQYVRLQAPHLRDHAAQAQHGIQRPDREARRAHRDGHVTNSNGGGHTDKTSTKVQHRGLQLSATST